jgi:hypothetical protein
LWEDAAIVPKHVVLYGNLPTKNFYSDDAVPLEAVPEMARELIGRMRMAGHPHILGSECDVLHVPEASETIRRKLAAMLAVSVRNTHWTISEDRRAGISGESVGKES